MVIFCKRSLRKRAALLRGSFLPFNLSGISRRRLHHLNLRWFEMAPRSDECGVSPDRMSSFFSSFFLRSSSVSFDRQPAGKWRSWWNYTAKALGNICVPFGKYHEMRPHYAAEIHCSSAKSILSRAGDKKQLHVLLRSKRNSGHNLLRGGKNSEFQWLKRWRRPFWKGWPMLVKRWFLGVAPCKLTLPLHLMESVIQKQFLKNPSVTLYCSFLYFLAIRNVAEVEPFLFLSYSLRGWC